MSYCMRTDLLDPVSTNQELAKQIFAAARVQAKKVLNLPSGYFNELKSYAIYVFQEFNFIRFLHTPPIDVSDTLQRRQMYSEVCSYDLLESDYFPQKPKAISVFLITNYSKDAKVVQISRIQRPLLTNVCKELTMMDYESRPIRSKARKKPSLLRDVVRQVVSNDRSSGDEKPDSNMSKKSLEDTSDQKPCGKSTKQNSKHQGNAKTFKRKTKRRGRV